MGLFSLLFRRKQPKQIKLGLALGSGGAKGFAELGALCAFEENGISFDIVAGTSIGSVIGAFYADGYTTTDIKELLSRLDFGEILSVVMIKMDTQGMFNVVDRTIGSKTIEELKKPYMAVATIVETGEEYVFKSGSVAKAMCASSCYPPFFKPVVVDGVEMIDGAFCNSIPADLVKEMGADYIVGIDLATHTPNVSGILSTILPTYEGKVKEPWEKGYKFSNVVIHPDLSAYKATQFRLGDEMFEIGYNEALKHMPKILEDIALLRGDKKQKKKEKRNGKAVKKD